MSISVVRSNFIRLYKILPRFIKYFRSYIEYQVQNFRFDFLHDKIFSFSLENNFRVTSWTSTQVLAYGFQYIKVLQVVLERNKRFHHGEIEANNASRVSVRVSGVVYAGLLGPKTALEPILNTNIHPSYSYSQYFMLIC